MLNLPAGTDANRYRGLFVVDFGAWTATGYTADEVALLLDTDDYRHGKVYRIERVAPNGSMELRGVPPERFQFEAGMFFFRGTAAEAESDYQALLERATQAPPPSRAMLQLCRRTGALESDGFVTALIYPAECDPDVARWLVALDYQGGNRVEGGISHVTDFYAEQPVVLRREQLWTANQRSSRSREEILSSVRQALQR